MANRKFWAITSYFNPVGYRRRLANYRTFWRRLAVPLVAVEFSCGGPFQLGPGDADVLVQLRKGDILWQKERLLNIALRALPDCCDKVAWLDCDVIFQRPDWAERTADALDRLTLVQPFHQAHDLPPDVLPEAAGTAPGVLTGHALFHLLARGADAERLLRGDMRLSERGHSGLAWAARREVLDADGFYDACVLGSGNRAMVCAALGRFDDAMAYLQMNPRWRSHYLAWAGAHFDQVRGRIGFVEGDIHHLWHGDLRQRRYLERHQGFAAFQFDPAVDIACTEEGCWKWNTSKPQMHAYVRSYFASRKEDGERAPATRSPEARG